MIVDTINHFKIITDFSDEDLTKESRKSSNQKKIIRDENGVD